MKQVYFTPSAIFYSCAIISDTLTYSHTYITTLRCYAQCTIIKKIIKDVVILYCKGEYPQSSFILGGSDQVLAILAIMQGQYLTPPTNEGSCDRQMPQSVEFVIISLKIESQCRICNGTIKWRNEETNKVIPLRRSWYDDDCSEMR